MKKECVECKETDATKLVMLNGDVLCKECIDAGGLEMFNCMYHDGTDQGKAIPIGGIATAAVPAATPTVAYPYTAEVGEDGACLRSGPSREHHLIKNEGAGILLLLVAERKGWSKVAIPGDVVLWVAKKYIDSEYRVTASRLNVRAGPGLKYPRISRLTRGQKVTLVDASDNKKWLGIRPPPNAYAWVKSTELKYRAPKELYSRYAFARRKCHNLFSLVEVFRKQSLEENDYKNIPFDDIIFQYRDIATRFPSFPEGKLSIKRIEEMEKLREKIKESARKT